MSLAILALVSSFGPWGAYSVSRHNQLTRLRSTLEAIGILQNGTVIKSTAPVSFEQSKSISTLVDYLVSHHGVSAIQPWFKEDLNALASKQFRPFNLFISRIYPSVGLSAKIVRLMGIEYLSPSAAVNDSTSTFNFAAINASARPITGYDYLVPFNIYEWGTDTKVYPFTVENEPYDLVLTTGVPPAFKIRRLGKEMAQLDLGPLLSNLRSGGNADSVRFKIPPSSMTCTGTSNSLRVKIIFKNFIGRDRAGGPHIDTADGELLLSFNPKAKP